MAVYGCTISELNGRRGQLQHDDTDGKRSWKHRGPISFKFRVQQDGEPVDDERLEDLGHAIFAATKDPSNIHSLVQFSASSSTREEPRFGKGFAVMHSRTLRGDPCGLLSWTEAKTNESLRTQRERLTAEIEDLRPSAKLTTVVQRRKDVICHQSLGVLLVPAICFGVVWQLERLGAIAIWALAANISLHRSRAAVVCTVMCAG
eukprot:1755634-Amphidinium_carterae.1